MIGFDRHRYFLVQILKDIYSDAALAPLLGFKGGTALMLFHELDRFSVDLDFNLLTEKKRDEVYAALEKIVLRYGKLKDQAIKHFGLLLVLDYGAGERNLKLEVSQRQYPDRYEVLSYLGIPIQTMVLPDMFAHKLAAVLDRKHLTNRDLYDLRFFLQKRIPLNKALLELRTKDLLTDYLNKVLAEINILTNNKIMHGLGDLLDEDRKLAVKKTLLPDLKFLLQLFRDNPLIEEAPFR